MQRVDANAILAFWWDRQENQVGPTFKFKVWIDDKGRMRSPVAKNESDRDADDESPRARHTRKPSATATSALTAIPKALERSTKRPYVSSSEDESNNTNSETSSLHVKRHARGHTNVEDSDHTPTATKTSIPAPQVTEGSDDESNGCKTNKASNQSTQASHGARTFSPSSTCQGLEHLATSPTVQEPILRRTRPASYVSPVVEGRQPKTVPAPLEHSLSKKKAARLAAGVPSDAPAKGTRSNAENSRATRTRQKPKKYADYI
ncbi:hypothetical protein BDR03DRAFT_1016834 [Suillus americanus]|nr:hypothetical protein BDR03DRAFT_1016834 [Suillus americanus]